MIRKFGFRKTATGVAAGLFLSLSAAGSAQAQSTTLELLTTFPRPTTALSESVDLCMGGGNQSGCVEGLAASAEGQGQAGSIGAYISRQIDEDQAAEFAAAIARGAGTTEGANAAFLSMASAFPNRAGEIAASVIAAAPGSEVQIAQSLEQVLLAAAQGSIVLGAARDGNPNANRVVDANQPFIVKSQGGPLGIAFDTRADTERDTPEIPPVIVVSPTQLD